MKLINTLILCGLLFTGGCNIPSAREEVATTEAIFNTKETVHALSIYQLDHSIIFRDTNGAVWAVRYYNDTNNYIKTMILPPFICR